MSTRRHVGLVTGANHGIGAAVAERLAAEGCAVVATYLAFDDEDGESPERLPAAHRQDASRVVERIVAAGGRAVAVSADLMDAASVPALYDLAEERFGPVDVLVNNATGSLRDTFRATDRDWAGRAVARVSADTVDRSSASTSGGPPCSSRSSRAGSRHGTARGDGSSR